VSYGFVQTKTSLAVRCTAGGAQKYRNTAGYFIHFICLLFIDDGKILNNPLRNVKVAGCICQFLVMKIKIMLDQLIVNFLKVQKVKLC